jgi:hypothetical protein
MRRVKRYLRLWHRWLGLMVSLILMHLAITGWLLNHSEDWQWSKRFMQAPWVLQAYGLPPPKPDGAMRMDQQHWISQWQQKIFIDQSLLLQDFQGQLVAALALPDFYLLATRDSLQAVNLQGERIWQLDSLDQLPSPLTGMSLVDQQVMLQTPNQNFIFDAKQLIWQVSSSIISNALVSQSLPIDLQTAIAPQVNQQQISWQQILLDVHSGRLFNAVLLMDVVAAVLVLLSVSGLLLFFRSRF